MGDISGQMMRLLRCETPLGVFSLLWALAASLHHLEAQPLAGLPLYPFAILLWLFPERLWAIASFAVAHTALLSLDLPAAANHSVLALMVNACLLIGCMQALRSNDPVSRRRRLWESIRGPVQATIAVVYFFAVFHKLNSSFFHQLSHRDRRGRHCRLPALAAALLCWCEARAAVPHRPGVGAVL